jgi:WASH complex subunit strumpellin
MVLIFKSTHFAGTTAKIGQMQLLRRQIANALNWLTKLDSNSLSLCLVVFNDALISDIQQHYQNPEKPYPSEDNPLLPELTRYLETAGIHDPYTKIYITTSSLEGFPVLMFLFVISQMPKFTYNRSLKTIMAQRPKDKNSVDATPFVLGVITLLKQFHSVYTQQFLAYLGQYVRSQLNIAVGGDEKARLQDYPLEVINTLLFLEEFCRYSKIDRKIVEAYLPPYIFDQFTH